jgi:hypothetical protein
MGYVKIKVEKVASREDLKMWEDRMMEKAKCWNKFCLDIYGENELRAVHVIKEGENENTYLTTLCEDCIKDTADYNLLVNMSHLVVEPHHKEE